MDQESNLSDLEYASAPSDAASNDGNDDSSIEAQRAQIEETRAQMSGTINAIEQRLSPENLAQRATQSVHDATIGKVGQALNSATDTVQQMAGSAESTGSSIIDTIKNNPIPAALAGLGIGWLIMSARNNNDNNTWNRGSDNWEYGNRSRYGNRYGYGYRDNTYGNYAPDYAAGGYYGQTYSGEGNTDQGMTGQVAGAAGQVANQAQNMANQAQNAAGQVADQVQNTAGQMANQVQDTAGQMMYQTQQTAQQAAGSVETMASQNPLAMGAVALALGAAVGLAIPETQMEDQWMGQASETVMQKAGDLVQEEVQKAKSVAEDTVNAAQQTAQQSAKKQGLTS